MQLELRPGANPSLCLDALVLSLVGSSLRPKTEEAGGGSGRERQEGRGGYSGTNRLGTFGGWEPCVCWARRRCSGTVSGEDGRDSDRRWGQGVGGSGEGRGGQGRGKTDGQGMGGGDWSGGGGGVGAWLLRLLLVDAFTQCGCGAEVGLRKWGLLFSLAVVSQETLMKNEDHVGLKLEL